MLYIGLALEKKAAARLPPLEDHRLGTNLKNFFSDPLWLVGFALTNVQMVPLWAALSFGPMSMVSPMLALGLVVLTLFSVTYLKETVTRLMGVGLIFAMGGVVLFGAVSGRESKPGWEQALALLAQPKMWVLCLALGLGVAVPIAVSRLLGHRHADIWFGLASGMSSSLGMLFAKLMMAGFSGDHFTRWQFYLFFLLVILGNGGSMALQQFGFQKGRAIVLTPIFTAVFVLVPAAIGVALFDEWAQMSRGAIGWKLGGMGILIAGVVLLSATSVRAVQPVTD